MDVTVKARQAVVINHFLLYAGETRRIPYGLAQQVMARYPGRLAISGGLPDAPAPTAVSESPMAADPEPDPAPKPRRKGRS